MGPEPSISTIIKFVLFSWGFLFLDHAFPLIGDIVGASSFGLLALIFMED